jgi:putative two-component system response regulator
MAQKTRILIADDIEANRHILAQFLEDMGYSVIQSQDGREALNLVMQERPDIVILDIAMPEMDGIEVCRVIKSNPLTKIIPVVIITALGDDEHHLKALDAGADDFLTKPYKIHFLKARLKSLLALKLMNDASLGYQESLKRMNVELMEKLISTQDITIVALAKLAEFRDPDTGEHLERMREYTRLIAQKLRELPKYKYYISDRYIENLYKSSPLHDIGKVGIRDDVLLKPGRLSHGEFELMKLHTTIGGDALATATQFSGLDRSFLDMGKEIAYSHHEKWNGSGYPRGLKGEQIPLSARILAIADVYDALTSKRVYKEAYPHKQARGIIVDECKTYFDPEVLQAFIDLEKQFIDVRNQYQDAKDGVVRNESIIQDYIKASPMWK